MKTIFTVKGMHCNACRTLITMELEEKSLDEKIVNISINETENIGKIELEDATDDELGVIEETINSMEQYTVIAKDND